MRMRLPAPRTYKGEHMGILWELLNLEDWKVATGLTVISDHSDKYTLHELGLTLILGVREWDQQGWSGF